MEKRERINRRVTSFSRGVGRMAVTIFLLAAFLAASSCSGTLKYKIRKPPKNDSNIAGRRETNLGGMAASYLYQHYPIYPDSNMQERVHGIGSSLAHVSERPNIRWDFVVIESDNPLSWSAPAGYVWISNGAVEHLKEDRYIAGVLAYQIGHVTAKHKYKSYRNRLIAKAILTGAQIGLATAGGIQAARGKYRSAAMFTGSAVALQAVHPAIKLVFKRYSKKDKLHAAQLAMRYLLRAGYNPEDYVKVLESLDRMGLYPGAVGTVVPDTELRIEHAKLFLGEIEGLEGLSIKRPEEEILVIKMQPVRESQPTVTRPSRKEESKGVYIGAEDYIRGGRKSAWDTYWKEVTTSGLVGLIPIHKKEEGAEEQVEEAA